MNYINNVEKDIDDEFNKNEYGDKYDIYDENEIPLNNYKEKIFKKTAIKQTKGKGKFIKKVDLRDCLNTYYCKCGKCQLNQYYSEKFDIMHSKSLFNCSYILTEYKKESNIYNDKNFFDFFIDEKKFDVKLIYRASENKFLIKNLIKNIKNNESKKTIGKLIIIKFSNDLYFAFLDSRDIFTLYGFFCFFTNDEIEYTCRFSKFFNYYEDGFNTFANVGEVTGIINLYNNKESERNDAYFSFQNSFSEVIFNRNIKLKHKYIKKNTICPVIDLECFNINYLKFTGKKTKAELRLEKFLKAL